MSGELAVGVTVEGNVVVNLPPMERNADGSGFISFTADQALEFARTLTQCAETGKGMRIAQGMRIANEAVKEEGNG